jgi:hypothetical protein
MPPRPGIDQEKSIFSGAGVFKFDGFSGSEVSGSTPGRILVR